MVLEQADTHMQMSLDPELATLKKKNFKVDQRPKCKS